MRRDIEIFAANDIKEALAYTISCLCSLRKNYQDEKLGLWQDVDRAITNGNAALCSFNRQGD
jgi:hypothetical protein